MSTMEEVQFPCDLQEWQNIKSLLISIASESHTLSARLLITKLSSVHELLLRHGDSSDGNSPRQRASVNKNVFSGLDSYLDDYCSDQEREVFFCRIIPFIIQKALEIQTLKPADGLKIAKHETSEQLLSRSLVASILACSLLCLWPGRPRYRRYAPLCAINFDGFYSLCKSRPSQCAKLKCILHYFETLSIQYSGPVGHIMFYRQVTTHPMLLANWLSYDSPLCHVTVHTSGFIEDAGPNVLQVDFANRHIGGAVLTTGAVQEEIRFCVCPELIAAMLFQPVLHDNEALLVQGFETFSCYKGYGRTLRYGGPCHDTAQADERGVMTNFLTAIDALPFKNDLKPRDQYRLDLLLRELNKAYTGFNQDGLKLRSNMTSQKSPEQEQAVTAMSGIVQEYFATLSDRILTTALQDTLICSQDENSASTASSSQTSVKLQQKEKRLRKQRSQNNVSRTSSQDCSSPVRSPLNNRRGSDVVGRRGSDVVGRRGSDVNQRGSDVSRRGSDTNRRGSDASRRGSDVSRRSSASTSGSRRSSGAHGSNTSESCPEIDEYFATYQPRHMVKSSTIEEEPMSEQQALPSARDMQFANTVPQSSHDDHSSSAVTYSPQTPAVSCSHQSSAEAPPTIVRPDAGACSTAGVAAVSDTLRLPMDCSAQEKSRDLKSKATNSILMKRNDAECVSTRSISDRLADQIFSAAFASSSANIHSSCLQKAKQGHKSHGHEVQGHDDEHGMSCAVAVRLEHDSDDDGHDDDVSSKQRRQLRPIEADHPHGKRHKMKTEQKLSAGDAGSDVSAAAGRAIDNGDELGVKRVCRRRRRVNRRASHQLDAYVDVLLVDVFYAAFVEVHKHHQAGSRDDIKTKATAPPVDIAVSDIMRSVCSATTMSQVPHHHFPHRQPTQTQSSSQKVSDDDDIDDNDDERPQAELSLFANEFVSTVLDDAVVRVRRQKRDEQDRLEAMWRRAQERFELDAMYFNAEFGRFCDDASKPKSCSSVTRSVGGPNAMLSITDHDLARRRSLDELRKYEHKSNGYHRQPQARTIAGCEAANGLTLDPSAPPSIAVNHQQCTANGKMPLLLVPGGRRASEPTATRRRSSFDTQLLRPPLPPGGAALLERRRSSQFSTSSREMILDWLQQQNLMCRHRYQRMMTSSPTTSSAAAAAAARYRTTSSHLDWFAQDLLLEAFNDAFKEMFGDALFFVDVISSSSGGGATDETSASANQSFSSSHGSFGTTIDPYDSINISVPSISSSAAVTHDVTQDVTPDVTPFCELHSNDSICRQASDCLAMNSTCTSTSVDLHSNQATVDMDTMETDCRPHVQSVCDQMLFTERCETNRTSLSDRSARNSDISMHDVMTLHDDNHSASMQCDDIMTSSVAVCDNTFKVSATHETESASSTVLDSRTNNKSVDTCSSQVHVHFDQVHAHSDEQRPAVVGVNTNALSGPRRESYVQGLFDNMVNETLESTVTSLTQCRDVIRAREQLLRQQTRDVAPPTRSNVTAPNSSNTTAPNAHDVTAPSVVRAEQTADVTDLRNVSAEQAPVTGVKTDKELKTTWKKLPTATSPKRLPIATGNWGCGAYCGDPQLKAMIQWLAASVQHAPELRYYTFAHPQLNQLDDICRQLRERHTTVGHLLQLTVDYCNIKQNGGHRPHLSLLDYLKGVLADKYV